MTRFSRLRVLLPAAFLGLMAPAMAATIANPVATFSGLDKITGRITNFDVYIDETVQFGALQITPRACYTRPPTETQRTSVFIEVDQVSLQQTVRRIFTGWMFADSPALNAIDHAVYDIWLIVCKQSSDVPPPETLATTPAVSAPALEPEVVAAPEAPVAEEVAEPATVAPPTAGTEGVAPVEPESSIVTLGPAPLTNNTFTPPPQ